MTSEQRHKLYDEFLEAFPLETLAELPIEKYTNLNKNDSFCYWLESKLEYLGSIWGGSSYKFDIFEFKKQPEDNSKYRNDGKYSWYARLGQTAEEAYEATRQAIVAVANAARKGDWDAVDKVKDLGTVFKWKIAFMYSNKVLVPIYRSDLLRETAERQGMKKNPKSRVPEIQRYLIQLRGNEDPFDFYARMLDILNQKDNKVWLYAPGEDACMWQDCLENNIMSIGWEEMGDLSEYDSKEALEAAFDVAYPDVEGSNKNSKLCLWEFSRDIRAGEIVYAKRGRRKLIGRGIVESDYIYDDTRKSYRNVHRVKWTHKGEWDVADLKTNMFPTKTLTEISKYDNFASQLEAAFVNRSENAPETFTDSGDKESQILKVTFQDGSVIFEQSARKTYIETLRCIGIDRLADHNWGHVYYGKCAVSKNPWPDSVGKSKVRNIDGCWVFVHNSTSFLRDNLDQFSKALKLGLRIEMVDKSSWAPVDSNPIEIIESYDKEKFLSEVFMSPEEFDRLQNLLRYKKNIILQGAPGVGKTFSATRLAYAIMGQKDDSRVEIVQFHQNYTYEDFIMGYKPNGTGFRLHTGLFYEFCDAAREDPERPYFFIIDEINRGNLSRIFGELLQLIENGYRDKSIKLAYNGEEFSVPSNLHIIGMMNTADRSLAMIDYALRRRFSFFTMHPGFDTDGFRNHIAKYADGRINNIVAGIKLLNAEIAKDDSLGDGFCIGHSYFCQDADGNAPDLDNVINFDIAPMLEEYWFDNADKRNQELTRLQDLLK